MSANTAYEAVLVFSLSQGEEAALALEEKFKAMIEAAGTIDSVDEWGKRRLEYLINDEEYGYYVLVNFQSQPEFPAELGRVLNITDGVLRSLVVKRVAVAAKAAKEVAKEAAKTEEK